MSSSGRRSGSLLAQVEQFLAIPQNPKPLQIVYSTHSTWPYLPAHQQAPSKQIDIGVLDSSFNPPHLAHAALAKIKKPHFAREERKDYYDSLLLIFSIRNADKGMGTKKDASTVNRLEMMTEFAKDLEEQTSTNVAVAIVEEPLMIAKSTLIHQYIEGQHSHIPSTNSAPNLPNRLHWLVGFDTLQRFFQVKYYPSPDYFYQGCDKFFNEEHTTFVCARRGLDSLPNKAQGNKDEREEERELLESEDVKPWVKQGSVVMVDLDKSIQGISSTLLRKMIQEGEEDKDKLEIQLQKSTTRRVAKYLVQESVYEGER
ncbi:hypothetical protein CBS101457_004375 [Exobasidium rhododendri]|nr:hypothetical protein CBS101457_004375 [Exobasidium rhododendri]